MADSKSPNEDTKRTIVLVYGILDTGAPFWLFAAVRPAKYQNFLTSYKEGSLDIHAFEPYGEIIVIGEGKAPPDEVILKVAEMYQTDANTLMESMKDEPAPNA